MLPDVVMMLLAITFPFGFFPAKESMSSMYSFLNLPFKLIKKASLVGFPGRVIASFTQSSRLQKSIASLVYSVRLSKTVDLVRTLSRLSSSKKQEKRFPEINAIDTNCHIVHWNNHL